MLFDEFTILLRRIRAYAVDDSINLLKIAYSRCKLTGFHGATGRVVLGVEIQNDPLVGQTF